MGKAHSEAVREIESKAGGVYRSWMEGAEERAREAARRDGLSVYDHYRCEDWYRLKRSASEERMEQVREIDGEQAYEKMRRVAVFKALSEGQREFGLRPPSPPSSPGPRAPGRRADSLDNPQTFYRFPITPMEPSVCSPPPPTVPTDLTSRSRRFRNFSKGASRTVSNKTRSEIDNSFDLAAR